MANPEHFGKNIKLKNEGENTGVFDAIFPLFF